MAEVGKCSQCPNEYEPRYYDVLGSHILVGQGLCPDCAQKAYDDEVAKEKAAQQASIMGVRRQRRQDCGIPTKFMNQDFSTFEKGWQDKAFKLCWEYAEAFPVDRRPTGYRSLYLWASGNKDNPSGNGTGKSHLSYAIAHRILDRWTGENDKACPRIICLREQELFRQIQATYSFTQEEKQMRESEDDIIKQIIYADLVVIDDVGKEVRANSDFVRKVLFSIINGRYDADLPLIITANLSPTQLKAHLDKPPTEASYSRFLEMTKKQSVLMDGRSYRRG
ncbi:MAG TPA: hypothetical protein VMW45_03705 [Dehalococcoidia bacterium]|nr:hypothetical protein [Dehalococcoidia bacterium]